MERPRLKLKFQPVDYLIEFIALIAILYLIIMPLYYYNDLPDTLPGHFNAAGQPDSFSGRVIIWLLPVIGIILYIGMTIICRFPHIFNYPVEVTENNAFNLYVIGTRTIRILKMIIVLSFMYLNLKTIMIGLNKTDGLGTYYLPVFLVIISLLVGIPIYLVRKYKRI